jgi:uncharacterized membrane protein YfcA
LHELKESNFGYWRWCCSWYSQDQSFSVIRSERRFVAFMVTGSLLGAFLGNLLLGVIPTNVILPVLAAILVVSAVKVWNHA